MADARRAFWIGSGISREQAPDLVGLIRHTLHFLRDRAWSDESDAADHDDALRRILAIHLPDEVDKYAAFGAAWEPVNLESTRNVYSQVLGTWVDGKPEKYLLLEVAGVPARYGDPSLEPGVDHRLIAVLVAEGVLSEMASGNWDGLIEKAVARATGSASRLSVHVIAEDLRDAASTAWLAKFHGCAVKALEYPESYEPAIIATTGQISVWSIAPEFAHLRNPLVQNVQQFRSLFLGLSVQDADLLNIFTLAASEHPWGWSPDHPAYVFAEPSISPSQQVVLQNSYSEFGSHRPEILERSAFGTYSSSLLAALVTFVIVEKVKSALHRSTTMSAGLLIEADAGVEYIERLVSIAVGADANSLLSVLDNALSRIVRQFFGQTHFVLTGTYSPIFDGPRTKVMSDPTLTMIGANWFALVLGIFGRASAVAGWRVRVREHDAYVFLEVRRPMESPVLVAVVSDAAAADAVLQLPIWESSPSPITILHTGSHRPNPSRSSGGRLGSARTEHARREVWLTDLLGDGQEMSRVIENMFAGGVS